MSNALIVAGVMMIISPFAWNIKTSLERPAAIGKSQIAERPSDQKPTKKNVAAAAVQKRENLKINSAAARGRDHSQILSPSSTAKPESRNPKPVKRGSDRCAKHESAIEKASIAHKVAPVIIKSVVKVESGCHELAKGSAGEKGLMQIKESTARDLGTDPAKLFDPEVNVSTGTKYLRRLRNQSEFEHVEELILAYNQGPGGARSYLRNNRSAKNHWHVKKVLRQIELEQAKMPKY